MPVKAKYIKDLPLKRVLDGSESLLVQDLNGTQQAPLGTIVDEIKQNSQEKIREIESELAQTNAQLSDISKLSLKLTEQSNFHERLCEAIGISSETGQVIEIASGEYELSETIVIDNPIRIRCNENVVIKSTKTFFNIKSSAVEITGNPNLKVDNSDIAVIAFNSDSNQTISDCNLEVLITKTGSQTDVVGILFETSTWHNSITINSKWLNTVLKFNRTWHNGNKYFGKSLGFRKGIYFTGNSSGYGNLFNLEFEHTVDGVTCYGVITDATGGGGIRNNKFNINHWVDNAIGKYYIISNPNHYCRDNEFSGQLEGLIDDVGGWNIFRSNFYTKRDRELNPSDMQGSFNAPLYNQQKTLNYVDNGDLSFGDVGVGLKNTKFSSVNSNIRSGLVYDAKAKKNVIEMSSSTTSGTGYIVYKVRDFEKLKGRRVTFIAKVLGAKTNKNTDYMINIQDGVSSINSIYYGMPIKSDGEWHRVWCSFVVDENAKFLQLELGRRSGGAPYYSGEILRFDEITLIEGYYGGQEFVTNTSEVVNYCEELPVANESRLGKFAWVESSSMQGLCVCVKSGSSYLWKKINLTDI